MYTIYIFTAIGIILGWLLIRFNSFYKDIGEYISASFFGMIIGWLIGYIIMFALPLDFKTTDRIVSLQPISDKLYVAKFEDGFLVKYLENDTIKTTILPSNLTEVKFSKTGENIRIVTNKKTNASINDFANDFDFEETKYVIETFYNPDEDYIKNLN